MEQMCIGLCCVALTTIVWEVGGYMNLALRNVFPNKDRHASRGSVSTFKTVIGMILFKSNGARFFLEGFLEARYFGTVVGQKVLKFLVISPDSAALPL